MTEVSTPPRFPRPPLLTPIDAAAGVWFVGGDEAPRDLRIREGSPGTMYLWRLAPGGPRWFLLDAAAGWLPLGPERRVNVRDMGAAGDGRNDDAPAVRRALTAGAGGEVVFPKGHYLIDPHLPLKIAAGTALTFEPGAQLLLAAPTKLPVDAPVLEVPAGGDGVRIRGLLLDGQRKGQQQRVRGLVVYRSRGVRIENVQVLEFTGSGIVVGNCPDFAITAFEVRACGRTGSPHSAEAGMSLNAGVDERDDYFPRQVVIDGGRVTESGLDGIILSTADTRIRAVTATDNGCDKPAAGIYFTTHPRTRPQGLEITACDCSRNSGNGIDTGPNAPAGGEVPFRNVYIARCRCDGNGGGGIQLDDVDGVLVEGCVCSGNGRSATTGQRAGIVLASQRRARAVTLRHNRCGGSETGEQRWGLQLGVLGGAVVEALVVENNDLSHNAEAAVGGVPAVVARARQSARSWQRNRGDVSIVSVPDPGGRLPRGELQRIVAPMTVRGTAPGAAGDRMSVFVESDGVELDSPQGSGWRLSVTGTVARGTHLEFLHDGIQWREFSRTINY